MISVNREGVASLATADRMVMASNDRYLEA
jgi:hypothetical protein